MSPHQKEPISPNVLSLHLKSPPQLVQKALLSKMFKQAALIARHSSVDASKNYQKSNLQSGLNRFQCLSKVTLNKISNADTTIHNKENYNTNNINSNNASISHGWPNSNGGFTQQEFAFVVDEERKLSEELESYEHSLQIHQPHHLQSRSPTISSAKSDAPFNQNRSLALGSTLSRPTTSDEYQNRHAIVPRTSFPPVRSLNQMYMRTLREDLMSVRQRVREAEQSFHMRSFPYRTQSEESESLYKQAMEHYDDIDSARH